MQSIKVAGPHVPQRDATGIHHQKPAHKAGHKNQGGRHHIPFYCRNAACSRNAGSEAGENPAWSRHCNRHQSEVRPEHCILFFTFLGRETPEAFLNEDPENGWRAGRRNQRN